MRYYRVSQDPQFNPNEPIKKAFLRTYKGPKTDGDAKIVCGHYTNISQPGQHMTWRNHITPRYYVCMGADLGEHRTESSPLHLHF